MTMSADVHQAILICAVWAEQYGHQVEQDAAYAVMAWLDAQPETPKRWEPIASGEVIELDGDVKAEIGQWGAVVFRDVETGEQMAVSFPPRFCICILTEE